MSQKYFKPRPGYNLVTGYKDESKYRNSESKVYTKTVDPNIVKLNQNKL